MDNGAMAREQQLDLSRGFAFDLDRFVHNRHRLETAPISVLARILGVGLIDVEVLLIDTEYREAECDLSVMPNRNARQCRLTGTDNGQPRRIQVHDVAQRRHTVCAVRIIGENRTTGSGATWRDSPVIRTNRIDGTIRLSKEGFRIARRALLAWPGEGDSPCCKFVVLQDRTGNGARVEPGRDLRGPVRLQLATEAIGGHAAGTRYSRPLHLRNDVPRQSVAADTNHVFRMPNVRLRASNAVLNRQ